MLLEKYKTKSEDVDVCMWTGDTDHTQDPEWLVKGFDENRARFESGGTAGIFMVIKTVKGRMFAFPGDYIVLFDGGEFYPFNPVKFNESFSLVDR
jgi:hypothetical protein